MALDKLQKRAILSAMILAGLAGCGGGTSGVVPSLIPMAASPSPSAATSTPPSADASTPPSAAKAGSIADPIATSSTGGGTSTGNNLGAACAPWAVFPASGNAVSVSTGWVSVDGFSVTYLGNGNTGGSTPVDQGRYQSGTTVKVLGNTGNLSKAGYSFAGWNLAANGAGAAIAPLTRLTMGCANLTLYAQWTLSSGSYTVTYAGNGSVSGFGLPDPNQYTAGSTVTVYGNLGFFFKPGYSFAGWNTAANGSGADYSIGDTFTMGNGNVTLYAQWSATDWPPASIWGGARAVTTLKANGTLWSWGLNAKGQLGDGTTANSSLPVQVLGPGGTGFLSGIIAVMGGEQHNFALKSDGTVWAWGDNSHAQLGNGTTTNSSTPVQVSGLTSIVKLGGRGYHSVAVKSDGTVWTWGWDEYGALGNGVDDANIDYLVPIEVAGVTNPILVSSGFQFSVALLQDHTLMAWGNNLEGEIGDGTTTNRLTPVAVPGIDQVVWVSAGWTHVVAIRADGTVWVWGANNWQGAFDCEDSYDNNSLGFYCGYGMLGDGTENDHSTPEQVPGLSGAIMALGGDSSTSVLLNDGSVWSFGSNGAGQLGVPSIYQSLVPVQVQGLCSAVYIMTRDFHNVALCADGTMWTWGSGLSGELGNGNFVDSAVPVQVLAF